MFEGKQLCFIFFLTGSGSLDSDSFQCLLQAFLLQTSLLYFSIYILEHDLLTGHQRLPPSRFPTSRRQPGLAWIWGQLAVARYIGPIVETWPLTSWVREKFSGKGSGSLGGVSKMILLPVLIADVRPKMNGLLIYQLYFFLLNSGNLVEIIYVCVCMCVCVCMFYFLHVLVLSRQLGCLWLDDGTAHPLPYIQALFPITSATGF